MKNICNQNILQYLSFSDLVTLTQLHKIDEQDIIDLCFFSKGDIFRFFPKYIKTNLKYIQIAIDTSLQGYAILRHVPSSAAAALWKYTEFTYSNYFKALKYVSSHKGIIPCKFYPMFQDKGFIFICLRNDGCRLKQFAWLSKSRKWVDIAIMQNGNALMYASNDLKNDVNLVTKCVSKFPWAIEYVGNQCIKNKNVIDSATQYVKWVTWFIKYAES
ncbi:MAG: hypothetical protein CML47_01295 [Rhodobacteraceae bacterium]|nr:MAG: hypothetical protein CML47_01295 [Paracoccaceae bacterium]|tara:strand:- start:1169 stop:1816 length:648 start_codon:yes stop_codon:yes gene_type:complete